MKSRHGATAGALMRDVSRDHLRTAPSPGGHECRQFLTGTREVPGHPDPCAVSPERSYHAGGPCRLSDASAYGLGMKVEDELVAGISGLYRIEVPHSLAADEQKGSLSPSWSVLDIPIYSRPVPSMSALI